MLTGGGTRTCCSYIQGQDSANVTKQKKKWLTGRGTRTGCLPRTTFSTAFLSFSLMAHLIKQNTWSRKTTLVFVKFVCWMLMSLSIFLNKMYPAARNSMPAKAACSPSKCLISRLLNIKLSSHKWPKAKKMMIMDTYPKVCRAPTHGRGSILLLCLLPPSWTKLKFSEIEKKVFKFSAPN